jgi:xanthine dehydrogenase accessory factor
MTHDFKRDKELLTLLRKKKLRYLGLLGSKLRTLRLLETDDMPERIRSPVGIPIGAEGPEEIAISILADVIKNLRNDLADSQEEG